MAGNKLAVVVGCNYPGKKRELHGCINDVIAMYNTLVDRFGFDPQDIVMLTDAPNDIVDTDEPTGANIKRALRDMIDQAESGDVLVFHFSGHGALLDNRHDDAIVPCDFNKITDHDFRMLVNRVPDGTSFTILSDSCHSGGLIDKEKEQIGPHHMSGSSGSSQYHKVRGMDNDEILEELSSMSGLDSDDLGHHLVHLYGEDASPVYHRRHATRNVRVHQDNGILLSGCQRNELSMDVRKGRPHGAFTNALLSVLNRHEGPISNVQLVRRTRKLLQDQGFNQHSCLYCSDDNADAPFLGEE